MSAPKARVFGLDVVRAFAIVSVVVAHTVERFPTPHTHRLECLGTLGVEIFFVLSGYLIGGILIKLIDQRRFSRPGELLHFWLNRWFRTLPLYYFYLAIVLLLPRSHMIAQQFRLYALYPFFLQKFAWNIPKSNFSHSWSLTVEEFFYLFFPLFLWTLFRILPGNPRRPLLITIAFFLVVPLLLRLLHGPSLNMADFDASMRKWVVFRLDALMFGVGVVVTQRYFSNAWRTILRLGPLVAAFALAVFLLLAFGPNIPLAFPPVQFVLFPIISLSAALTLPFADQWKLQPGICGRIVEGISASSYSTYLAHAMFLTFAQLTLHLPLTGSARWVTAPAVILYILAAGYVSYLIIEKPLMRLREMWNKHYAAHRPPAESPKPAEAMG